jgi:hypothetical protein
MRSLIAIFIALTFFNLSHGFQSTPSQKTKEDARIELLKQQINELNSRHRELAAELERLNKNIERQDRIIERDNNLLNTQLSLAQYTFAGAGIFMVVISIAVGFFVYFQQQKISETATNTEKMLSQMNLYKEYISGNLYSLNNKLQEEEALDLLEKLQRSPRDFYIIFTRLQILNIPIKHFSEFKKLAPLSNDLPLMDIRIGMFQPKFQHELLILLLRHFPKESFSDKPVKELFLEKDVFMDLSSYHRRKCIDALFEVVRESGLKDNLLTIEKILSSFSLDSKASSEMFGYFKKVFGTQLIMELKKSWNGTHFGDGPFDDATRKKLIAEGLMIDSSDPLSHN